MEMQITKMTTITLALTGGLVLGSVPPSIAASIPINPLVMKTAGQGSVTNVRSRQDPWNSDGVVAGTIIGGLAAATAPTYESACGYGAYAVNYGYRPYGYGYYYRPYGYYGYRPYGYGHYRYRPYGFGAPYWYRGWDYRWYRYPWR
jgi:hypothetical protein